MMKIPKIRQVCKIGHNEIKKIFINEWNVYQIHLTLHYNIGVIIPAL